MYCVYLYIYLFSYIAFIVYIYKYIIQPTSSIHTYIHTFIHTYIHTYIHIVHIYYIYIHIYIIYIHIYYIHHIHIIAYLRNDVPELITASVKGTVKFSDIRSMRTYKIMEVQKSNLSAFAVHPSAPILASGSWCI